MKELLLETLHQAYDLVLVVELKNGQYQTRKIGNHSPIYFFPDGDFQKGVDYLIENKLHPFDVCFFRKTMNLSYLIKHLCGGMREVRFQYRVMKKNESVLWLENRIYLHMDEENPKLIIFVRDITKDKEVESSMKKDNVIEEYMDVKNKFQLLERDGVVIFESNIELNSHYTSPQISCIFAGDYDNRLITQVWEEDGVYHPGDGYLFRQLKHRLFVECKEASVLIRLLNKKEEYQWCRVMAKAFTKAEGGIDRLIGVIM